MASSACAAPTISGDPGDDTSADAPTEVVHEPDLPISSRFQPLADKLEAERGTLGAPGVAALIIENGEVTFAHGFGTVKPGGDPVHASSLFRIGSVTKMMTTTALMRLVASGDVSLDDPVTKAIPGFKVQASAGTASSIRVRDLLSHATGLYDYIVVDSDHDDGALSSYLTGGFTGIEYMMAPARAFWNYSNPNFYLAGLVTENVGGVPYRQAVHDQVWAPLGMNRTTFEPADVIADGDFAYGLTGGEVESPDAYDNAWARPAGFAFSTVFDLGRFAQFLIAGDASVLADAQRRQMETGQIDMQDAGTGHMEYGFGLFVQDFAYLADGWHDARIVQHGGDINGFAADVYTVPDTGFAMVVLANTDSAHFTDSIDFALGEYANLAPATQIPDDIFVDTSTFASLAGSYQDDFNVGRVIVSVKGTTVSVSMPDLDAAKISYEPTLEPFAPDTFGITIGGYEDEITFIRDAGGAPKYIRDRFFVANRSTSQLAGASHPVDAAKLRARLADPSGRPSARAARYPGTARARLSASSSGR